MQNPWIRDWLLFAFVGVGFLCFRTEARLALMWMGIGLGAHSALATMFGNVIAGAFFNRKRLDRIVSPGTFWAFVGFYFLAGAGMLAAAAIAF